MHRNMYFLSLKLLTRSETNAGKNPNVIKHSAGDILLKLRASVQTPLLDFVPLALGRSWLNICPIIN